MIDADSGNPCDLIVDGDEGQTVAKMTWNVPIDEDVLEAAASRAAQRPEAIPSTSIAHRDRDRVRTLPQRCAMGLRAEHPSFYPVNACLGDTVERKNPNSTGRFEIIYERRRFFRGGDEAKPPPVPLEAPTGAGINADRCVAAQLCGQCAKDTAPGPVGKTYLAGKCVEGCPLGRRGHPMQAPPVQGPHRTGSENAGLGRKVELAGETPVESQPSAVSTGCNRRQLSVDRYVPGSKGGQEPMPNQTARESQVSVAWIVIGPQSSMTDDGLEGCSTFIEQGATYVAANSRYSRKAPKTTAGLHAQQNGLRLVVSVVRCEHHARVFTLANPLERCVSSVTGVGFEPTRTLQS